MPSAAVKYKIEDLRKPDSNARTVEADEVLEDNGRITFKLKGQLVGSFVNINFWKSED